MQQIGLVGVGFIGKYFVDRLREAGYPLTVFDVEESQVAYAVERGAEAAANPAAVASAADVLLLSLPGTPEVEAVMEGDDGALSALDPGDAVVDTTTTLPRTATEYEAACAERDVRFVAAPLTRAAPVEGVHMMVGGSEASYGAARGVVEAVSDDHLRFDDVESALRFKYLLQIRYASRLAIDAEIVEFARDADLDPRPLSTALGMDVSEKLLEDDYTQDVEGLGGLAIWNKDLGYALEVAARDDAALPLTSAVHAAYKHGSRVARPGEGDAATIARYWRALNGR